MSRKCQLTGTTRMHKNRISIERSRVTRRFPGFSYPNLQTKTLESEVFGPISMKICIRALRTIEKKNGIDNYLLKTKAGHLTPEYVVLKKRLCKIMPQDFSKVEKKTRINARKIKKQELKNVSSSS